MTVVGGSYFFFVTNATDEGRVEGPRTTKRTMKGERERGGTRWVSTELEKWCTDAVDIPREYASFFAA